MVIIGLLFEALFLIKGYVLALPATAHKSSAPPIIIESQGSFFVGGKTIKNKGKYDPAKWLDQKGQTRHGDHAYVAYQIPPRCRKYPVLFVHGAGQSGKCWETTPDGRDGFVNMFLRRGYAVFNMDQPRMGRAGMGLCGCNVQVSNLDQFIFDINRLGIWPKFYKGVQFPQDKESMEQFYSQMTPNTAGYNNHIIIDAIVKTFEKMGVLLQKSKESEMARAGCNCVRSSKKKKKISIKGILITHSQSCEPGWYAATRSPKIKAIVAVEPAGGFPFPRGECPGIVKSASGILRTSGIQKDEFLRLTKIQIILIFGDNIPKKANNILGEDNWYQRLVMAKKWVATINKYGGNARVIHLPEYGIKGNTHFMFMDKNNTEVAKIIFEWIEKL